MKKMAKTFIFIQALCLSAMAYAQVSDADSEKAFKLMEATDNALAYKGDYSATMSVIVEQPGKAKQSLQYKIFQRTDQEKLTLVQLFPEADKGTGYLMDGDNIWVYDPISRKFTHTSLKEALGESDIKLDDVDRSKTHWRDNYKVSELKSGNLGKYEVYIVTLTAKTTNPSYAKTSYYIRKDVNLILKQEDFSSSGRLMRTTLIPKYTKVPAGYVPTQIIMRDEINVGESTQEIISDLTFDKLPDTIFTKAYIESLN